MESVFPKGPGSLDGSADSEPYAQFTSQVLKCRGDILAYLLAATRSLHDAEDLLQESLLAAVRSARDYKEGTNFRAWLREICRRRVLEFMKKSKRYSPLVPELLDRFEEAAREAEGEGLVERRRRALDECLDKVRGLSRQALEMRYEGRLDVPRIARSLGKPLGATYALLNRARQALRRCVRHRLETCE